MKARPTIYKGIQMRSRLEAAFAETLDRDRGGFTWSYEGNAYASEAGQYLPDFVIHRDDAPDEYYEIKPPNADFDAALEQMHIILDTEPSAPLSVWTRIDQDHNFQPVRSCHMSRGCGRCYRTVQGALHQLIDDAESRGYGGPGTLFLCGQCRGRCTHLISVKPYDPIPSEGRLSVELTFECEFCPQHTIWNLQQIKGDTWGSFHTSPAPVGELAATTT